MYTYAPLVEASRTMFEYEDNESTLTINNCRAGGLCRIGDAVAELLARYPFDVETDADGPCWTNADADLASCAAAN